jgi:dienelactone hydrolase
MNKNNCTGNYLTEKVPIKHLLLIMRTTFILLFTCVFCSLAEFSYTQNANVTIDKRNASLKEVLNEIEKQTDYLFIYNNEVNTNEKVTVKAKQKAVSDVLSSILESKEMNYSMEGNHILLSKKENTNSEEVSTALAQQQKKQITGTVVDQAGDPIIGANIIELGTTNGTVTDIDGNFILTVQENAKITITYIGYLQETIEIGVANSYSVVMVEDLHTLQEVVAIGYGTTRKESLVGAVSAVTGDEIASVHSTNVTTAISGRLPGAVVIQATGEPGLDDARILVRGRTTLGDDTGPLVVIDGIPGRSLYEIDGITKLNGWILKPADFNPAKKYPVVMIQYSGPNSQQVVDKYNAAWYYALLNEGILVACVDGRGTGARGEEFRKSTYLNLGIQESDDQAAAARYLGSLSYVDADRIGIWGWSYGGYNVLMSMSRGNGVFKAGVAIAPVTDWRFYDTVYTERFMRTPQQNNSGYVNGSAITLADKLQGNLLLIHGTADDNVHFQNSIEYTRALINANKHFDMFFFPDKNHFISGENTSRYLYDKVINYFKNNL